MIGQFGPRRRNEFVQALEIAGRLEKMFGFGLIHGCLPFREVSHRIRP